MTKNIGEREGTMEGNSTRNREAKGIALIVALLVLLVLSTMGAAMVFVTQTEIWSSANYRTMLQARYAAEAGAQSAINWFEYTYTPPTGSQLSTNYTLTTYPVQCSTGCTSNGHAIVLSAMDGVTSNYPDSTQQTSFNSTLYNGSVPGTNVNTATFQVSAKLLRATSTGYLTWQITSTGKASGASSGTIKGGQVQLVTTYEQSSTTGTTQTLSYGLFATGTGCNSMTISSGITTDSYNSSSGPYSSSKNTSSGGDIGSNGSLLSSGTTNIHGNLWLQHPSVGSCPSADISYSGSLAYNNADTLTSTYSPPSPNPVSTPTTTTVLSGGTTTLSPGTLYGNIIASGTNTLSFPSAGTYDINSITASGSLTFQLPSSGGQVILNIGGNSAGAISLAGVTLANPNANQVANDFIIYYAGTSGFTASGFTSGAAVLYAPNAPVTLSGTTPWYGAIVSKTFTDSGGAAVHFDTALETAFGTGTGSTPGPYRQVGFTWSKF